MVGFIKKIINLFLMSAKKEMVFMITKEELNPKNFPLTEEQKNNLQILHERINKIRSAYGKPMIVTSGVRDVNDHIRIYREKGISDDKIPMGSKHLKGQAVDIADSKKELADWCKNNQNLLEEFELWLEDLDSTVGWVHFQTVPPKSGKRFFKP